MKGPRADRTGQVWSRYAVGAPLVLVVAPGEWSPGGEAAWDPSGWYHPCLALETGAACRLFEFESIPLEARRHYERLA